MKTKKLTFCAILVALALCMSLLERFLPLTYLFPLPGIKLGLSNLVTLFALYFLGFPYACAILVIRCVLGSIFAGSLTSLAYSLTGGILSILVSFLAIKLNLFSVYGVSLLGACAHSIGQVIAASVLLGSISPFGYLPLLLCVSFITGLVIGSVSSLLLRNLSGIPAFAFSNQEDSNS